LYACLLFDSELIEIADSELMAIFDRLRLGMNNRDQLGTMISFTSE